MNTKNVSPAAPGGAGPWAVLAPQEEDGLYKYTREVKEVKNVRLKALRIGDVYIVAFRDCHGEKNYAILKPGRKKVDSYDNWAEFADSLVEVLKANAGARVEVTDIDAVVYIMAEERVNKYEPSWRSVRELKYVKWGDGEYGLLLYEGEELVAEGP